MCQEILRPEVLSQTCPSERWILEAEGVSTGREQVLCTDEADEPEQIWNPRVSRSGTAADGRISQAVGLGIVLARHV